MSTPFKAEKAKETKRNIESGVTTERWKRERKGFGWEDKMEKRRKEENGSRSGK
jgi:type VI protein secretion system component Hcp